MKTLIWVKERYYRRWSLTRAHLRWLAEFDAHRQSKLAEKKPAKS
jgi:hypothetical protein